MGDINKSDQIPEFLRENQSENQSEKAGDAGSTGEFENIARAIEDMIEQRTDDSHNSSALETESFSAQTATPPQAEAEIRVEAEMEPNSGAHDTAWAIEQILNDEATPPSQAVSTKTESATSPTSPAVKPSQSELQLKPHTMLDQLVLQALEPLLEKWVHAHMAEAIAPLIRAELKNRVIRSTTSTTEMSAEPERIQNIDMTNRADRTDRDDSF